jgi:hypothetical protein
MYTYLLSFSNSLGTQEQVKVCLESFSNQLIWRYDMPNAFYIVSDRSAREISEYIRGYFKNKGLFIMTEIVPLNCWGWLTDDSWYLIVNKQIKEQQ